MDAERPGLVGAGDDAGAGLAVGDADGLAAVFGVVQLFDGREEGVHVHEGDEARPVVVGVRHGTIGESLFIDFEAFYGDAKLAATVTKRKDSRGGDLEAVLRRLINACEKELKKEMKKIIEESHP